MNIVYFYQYFSTPKGSWGTRVYEISKKWVEEGHNVTVVTSVYSKSDIRANKFIEDQNIDGINVKIINISIDNKQGKYKRILSFLLFFLTSLFYALTLKGDKFIVSSGPISVGLLGIFLKFRNKDVTLEVRDIWPDTAIEMGVINNRFVINLTKKLEKYLYVKMNRTVSLSPGMMSEIKVRGGSKVISIPNFVDLNLFINNNLLFEQRVNNYAIYFGNLGAINNSESLIEIAKRLETLNSNFNILVVGDGPMVNTFKSEAAKLKNIKYLGLLPKNKIIPLIQQACFAFVPLADKPILNTSSPNKLFESLACGVPVIQNTSGWIKDLLENNGIGYTFKSNDYSGVASFLNRFKVDDDYLNSRIRCRLLAVENFDKNSLALAYLKFLNI